MKLKRIAPIVVATLCTFGALAGGASASTDVQQGASENWSGYVSSGNQNFSSVSGSWVQPTAKCASGSGKAAFWVGLGGSGQSQSLEQTGTEADCSSAGAPQYFAWYELVPSAPVRLGLTISPGDHIASRVSVNAHQVTVWLSDQTTGQSVTKTLSMSNPDTSSAEWIAEAPSQCDGSLSQCQTLPLADFGTVTFTGASATGSDGHSGPISDPEWNATAVTLSPGAGSSGYGPQYTSAAASTNAGATPSSLSTDSSSFSVSWSDSSAQATGAGSDPYGTGGGYYVVPGGDGGGGGYYVVPGGSDGGGGYYVVPGASGYGGYGAYSPGAGYGYTY